jgi:hypothetical protein
LSIGESLDEDAADYAACLKPDLLAGYGVVPLGEWDASWGFVGPEVDGVDDGVELVWVGGEGGGPNGPVEFGVVGAAVEGKALSG